MGSPCEYNDSFLRIKALRDRPSGDKAKETNLMTNDTKRALEIIEPMAKELNIEVSADDRLL